MNRYYYDDGGNRTKLVHRNAVYSKDGNGRIVSMLTKASENPNGVTKVYAYNNGHELTAMTKYEHGQQTGDNAYLCDNAGRPLGSESFVEKISTLLGRDLRKQKPGRKPKEGRYKLCVTWFWRGARHGCGFSCRFSFVGGAVFCAGFPELFEAVGEDAAS